MHRYILFLFVMLVVEACLDKGESLGDTMPDAKSFDEFDYINSNYHKDMIVNKITMCEDIIQSNNYLTSIQIELLDTEHNTLTGDAHGPGTGNCASWQPTGRILAMDLGLRRHYS